MATPTEIVRSFVALWEKPGGFAEAVRDYFTAATVWENVGMLTTTGPDEAIGFFQSFGDQAGMETMRVDMLAIAAAGNKVLTERIDHVIDKQGETVMSIGVMGIFEVADGRITAWRDYFDTAGLSGGAQ